MDTRDMKLSVEVMPALEAIACRAIQIHARGVIDAISQADMPAKAQQDLALACERFVRSLDTVHGEVARRIACGEDDSPVTRYLQLLGEPFDLLMRAKRGPSMVIEMGGRLVPVTFDRAEHVVLPAGVSCGCGSRDMSVERGSLDQVVCLSCDTGFPLVAE